VLAVSLFVLVLSALAAFLFLFAKLQDLPRGGNPSAEGGASSAERPRGS
jgi:hypothetical protein